MTLEAVIYRDEDGYLCGSVPALLGCHSQGDTREELLENLKDAAQLWLSVQHEKAQLEAERLRAETAVIVI